MTKRKKILIGVAVAVVIAAIVGFSINARRNDQVQVETDKVKRKAELIAIVTATGEIKPKEYVELQAEISGVITDLYVQEGDFVDKDSILLKIDPVQTRADERAQQAILATARSEARNQQAQISVQRTNVERDVANVRLAEVEVENATQNLGLSKRNFDRKQGLYRDKLISTDLYDSARNELINAENALASSEARLLQAQAQLAVSKVVLEQTKTSYEASLSRIAQQQALLERSQDLLSKTVIRSPLAGVITQMNVEAGERAVPGTLNNPAATLMVIADLSVIEAEVEVDETDIVDLELGQPAVVKVDALPNTPIDGTVTEIGNSAIQTVSQEEAKDFKVVIQLEEPPASLRPGLSCTGEITTAVREDVIAVPMQALTVREYPVDEEGNLVRKSKDEEQKSEEDSADEEDQKQEEFEGVFRVVEGEAEFVPIETGILGDTEIEVLSGLSEGTEIITGSFKTLRDLSDGDAVESKSEERG
jgi:HlyD family secretion protein